MRLVDEVSERSIARALPAPSGPRIATGQVPFTLTVPVEPVSTFDVPSLPRLPASTPKPQSPATGQVATTLSLEAFLAGNASGTGSGSAAGRPAAQPKQRTHKRLIALAILVAITLILALVFRNSAFVERFTGSGYDDNPLPTHSFEQPVFTGSEYTITTQSIAMSDGLPTNYWETQHDVVNYTSITAKVTHDLAKASVIGGTIGTPQNLTPPRDEFVDQDLSYEPGKTETDPWIRTPHPPGWHSAGVLGHNAVLMYQDVIDPTLRNRQPTAVRSETRHETPVTTYAYTFEFGDFYESAPRLFDLVSMMDGNAAAEAVVTVTVSLDEQWMVRYLDVNVDYHSVLDHMAKKDAEGFYPYRYTMDVVKITDKPEAVDIPANAVDPPVETTTTTTIAAVTG
jgi:hypothetical protein